MRAILSRAVLRSQLGLLTIALAYAALETGGYNRPAWHASLFVIGLAALLNWSQLAAADRPPAIERCFAWTLLLIPTYVAIQLVPLPLSVINIVSPARAQTIAELGSVVSEPRFAPLSVNAGATATSLLTIVGYTLTFFLIRQLAWRSWQRRSWAVVIPLVAIGVGEAALGLMQVEGNAAVQGTYGNRDHFAGLLEMVLPMAVAYGVAILIRKEERSWAKSGETSSGGLPGHAALAGCLVLIVAGVILLGLVAAQSRMGFIAGLCGLFAMGVLALATTSRGMRKWSGVAGLAAACLMAFLFLPSDSFVGRFGDLVTDELTTSDGRVLIWRDSLQLVSDYLLFGCGLGNYGTAIVKYQTAIVDRAFTFAHNDYLQLASELGVVGFSMVMVLMVAVLSKTIRAVTQARDWNTRALALGCVGAMAAIAVHSVVDFNLYLPANALTLAWISGIAVSLPTRPSQAHAAPVAVFFPKAAIALACLLVVYAPVSLLAETTWRGDARMERQLCRFGICDTDAVLERQTAEHGGSVAAVPVPELVEALRRDAVSPNRWCDLGEAMARSGQMEQARRCFATALELGPHIPLVLLRAANFYHDDGDNARALAQTSRILGDTEAYDVPVFDWYFFGKLSPATILNAGLPPGARAYRAYVRYLIGAMDFDGAALAWEASLSNKYVDEGLARDYVDFVYRDKRYEAAARAWALTHADRRNGYPEPNRLFNGGFEAEPSSAVFDWRLESQKEDVVVALDGSVARTGSRSLRIRLGGQDNVSYHGTSQTAFVTPGVYRFQAFVRAQDITTDAGMAFRIFDPSGGRVDVRTPQVVGTTDWKTVEETVRVPQDTQLLVIQLVRERSLKFDSFISGTAWIDDVSLSKVE